MEIERPRSSGSRIPPLRSTDEVGHDLPVREAEDAQQRVGGRPSQFLSARAEAERAFQLAERLGRVRDGRNAFVRWAVLLGGVIS